MLIYPKHAGVNKLGTYELAIRMENASDTRLGFSNIYGANLPRNIKLIYIIETANFKVRVSFFFRKHLGLNRILMLDELISCSQVA